MFGLGGVAQIGFRTTKYNNADGSVYVCASECVCTFTER